MKISHMKKDELFEGFYLIKSADLRQTRAGKNYLAFIGLVQRGGHLGHCAAEQTADAVLNDKVGAATAFFNVLVSLCNFV